MKIPWNKPAIPATNRLGIKRESTKATPPISDQLTETSDMPRHAPQTYPHDYHSVIQHTAWYGPDMNSKGYTSRHIRLPPVQNKGAANTKERLHRWYKDRLTNYAAQIPVSAQKRISCHHAHSRAEHSGQQGWEEFAQANFNHRVFSQVNSGLLLDDVKTGAASLKM